MERVSTPVDVARFAMRLSDDPDGATVLRWEEPRDISRVVVRLDAPAPDGETAALQYWVRHWPGSVNLSAETGDRGWSPHDDWFTGEWRDADTEAEVRPDGALAFTFRPLAEVEFPEATDYSVTFRRTLQLRVVPREGCATAVEAYTPTEWAERRFEVEWRGGRPGDVRADVYNGLLGEVRALDVATVALTVTCAQCGPEDADRTRITVRDADRAFTFAASDVTEGGPVFLPDFGVLVRDAGDGATYAEAERAHASGRKCVYDRVFDMPEQTLAQATAAMPDPAPLHFVLGCAGARQKFRLEPNGDLALPRNFIEAVPGRDSQRLRWDGILRFSFGLPEGGARRLADGVLPIMATDWKDEPVKVRQTALTVPLEQSILEPDLPGDATVVCLLRFEATNTSGSAAEWELPIEVSADAGPEHLTTGEWGVSAAHENWEAFRFRAEASEGEVTVDNGTARYHTTIPAGATHTLLVKVPFITIDRAPEFQALAGKSFEAEVLEAERYWAARVAESSRIRTPEPDLNDFYLAHTTHVLITDDREPGADRVHTRVGSFYYGDFSNESCMIIANLDHRGMHREARRRLESYLHFQGTVGLPGNFQSQEGIFYGSGGYEHGEYNQHHGWVLWCMGEHYRLTRDEEWLKHAARGILRGCDWVIREREATKVLGPDGKPVLEYGFLPAGSLEDVRDYYYWLSTNAFTYRGLRSCADALTQAGHPEGERLTREADAYQADLVRGFTEQLVRAPVVRLRDGSCVPTYPSRLYLRGRDLGWIRETLEGSIHLIPCGLVEPDSIEAEWILKDFEDNRYISDEYGYSIEDLERDWFSLGGFSMQPNLLWGPVPYIQRDQVKHFLRAFMNSFASAFRADVRMLTEHPLPALGDNRGDHFKTSDEAQSCTWLRMMFLREDGRDLYVGQGLPRAWMADGAGVEITRAVTWFGETSFRVAPEPAKGRVTMDLDPPTRNAPERLIVRLRHPDAAPIRRVTVNGRECPTLDREREWIVLSPAPTEKLEIVAEY